MPDACPRCGRSLVSRSPAREHNARLHVTRCRGPRRSKTGPVPRPGLTDDEVQLAHEILKTRGLRTAAAAIARQRCAGLTPHTPEWRRACVGRTWLRDQLAARNPPEAAA